jgi:hypothetical protein
MTVYNGVFIEFYSTIFVNVFEVYPAMFRYFILMDLLCLKSDMFTLLAVRFYWQAVSHLWR